MNRAFSFAPSSRQRIETAKNWTALICCFLLLSCVLVRPVFAAKDDKSGDSKSGGKDSSKSGDKGKGGDQDTSGGSSPSASSGPFESQMLAYGAVDQIAKTFVTAACTKAKEKAIKEPDGSQIVTITIYDPKTFATTAIYGGFATNVAIIKERYNAIQQELSGGPKPSSAILDVASLILQYSAASTTQTSSPITLSDSAIRLTLANYLTSGTVTTCSGANFNLTAVYPGLVVSPTQVDAARKNVVDDLQTLTQLRISVEQALITNKKKPDDDIYKRFVDITKLHDQFVTSVITPDSSTGVAPIAAIVQSRALYDGIKGKNSYLIYEEAVAGGGTQKIRKNLFTNVFWGDLISYSGGAIINLALVNANDSSLLLAKTLRMRTDFTNIESPKDDSSAKAGDNLP